MKNYKDYISKKYNEYGEQFDESCLAQKFIPYFESGERIEVKFSHGEVKRGRIGITTGWKPSFLLMLRRSDHGSSHLLTLNDKILSIIAV